VTILGAETALCAATERHDWEELARFIADGGEPITAEIRNFIAAVLRGEVKRPKKRPASTAAVRRRHTEVARFVVLARKLGIKNATQKAAQRYNLDHRSVQRIVAGSETKSFETHFETMKQEITQRGGEETAKHFLALAALCAGVAYDIK
jgi:hypothetical protein